MSFSGTSNRPVPVSVRNLRSARMSTTEDRKTRYIVGGEMASKCGSVAKSGVIIYKFALCEQMVSQPPKSSQISVFGYGGIPLLTVMNVLALGQNGLAEYNHFVSVNGRNLGSSLYD